MFNAAAILMFEKSHMAELTNFEVRLPGPWGITMCLKPDDDSLFIWQLASSSSNRLTRFETYPVGKYIMDHVCDLMGVEWPGDVPDYILTAFVNDRRIKELLKLRKRIIIMNGNHSQDDGFGSRADLLWEHLTQMGLVMDIRPRELEW